jgi:hypothetical protein
MAPLCMFHPSILLMLLCLFRRRSRFVAPLVGFARMCVVLRARMHLSHSCVDTFCSVIVFCPFLAWFLSASFIAAVIVNAAAGSSSITLRASALSVCRYLLV